MVRDGLSAAERFLTLDDDALKGQCDLQHYRASGPGGQKRNKTSSAVRLRHRPTGLVTAAEDDRSQRVNMVRALRRMRRTIALSIRTPVDPEHYRRSTRLESYVTAGGAIRIAPRNPDYHLVICELLDLLASCRARVREAAACADVSTAHLVAFFRRDPKLWAAVNRMRTEAGAKALR
jgi:hypothetical protein